MTLHWQVAQTVCGIPELDSHREAGVTHVLSILDPEAGEPYDFDAYSAANRLTLRFHDIVVPTPGMTMPGREHVARVLAFGSELGASPGHLLVHCHAGVSRSTAALAALLLQANPTANEDEVFAYIARIRPQAWPNSVMISYADDLLGRDGRLRAAVRRFHGLRLRQDPGLAVLMRELGRSSELDAAEVEGRT